MSRRPKKKKTHINYITHVMTLQQHINVSQVIFAIKARNLQWFNQRSNCQHLLDHGKSKISRKTPICFIDYAKAFDCADHNKLWKILKEMGILDHLTWLLRNLYAGQKATVRTGLNNRLVPHRKRNMSRLYIVTLFI